MFGLKKDAPDIITKFEKEKNISSYVWVEEFVEGDDGKKVRTGSKREFAMNTSGQLVQLPKEVKDYFAKRQAEIKKEKAEKK
ncbi:MAG TPA: hypothetical protein PLM72_07400 [Spirochaetota bacterium]|nr:hypothetical protein [Spirochaetota bacterium]